MNPVFTFILGLLIGWLIEWLIDLVYWRRRYAEKNTQDDLKIIKGIGTGVEGKLHEAGIHTFEQLGSLTPDDLRQILGQSMEGLANPESLVEHARELARGKSGGA